MLRVVKTENGIVRGIPAADPRVRQGQVGELLHRLDVAAGGELRHHPAVEGVDVDLGTDLAGEDPPPVFRDGGGGLVAGGFDGEYLHGFGSSVKNLVIMRASSGGFR